MNKKTDTISIPTQNVKNCIAYAEKMKLEAEALNNLESVKAYEEIINTLKGWMKQGN